ncbi:velvet complex subunit B-like [Ischnura elegans]|uniref:velvet complex subunit B-like n=1 Tax=Ischnura elegans TaxID=197161 RepID=UPI001ED86868|nr:velvet complex subunit B-like [Ischnura elegans]
MGSLTMRTIMLGVFLITLQALTEEVESVQMRPMYGRPVPPSMAFRMRRDPPVKPMHMMGPHHGHRPPPSRRQYYSPNYRPLQRPRKSPPASQYHFGQPPKRTIQGSFATHKSHYAPFPKHEMGSRRPPYKYAPVGRPGPPKYHRPDSMHMKPYPPYATKTKYNSGYQQDYAPVRRPTKNTASASTVSFPSTISDNAQVIKGTREKPSYHSKPTYNSYASTTEHNEHSDYFAAPVSSSFHAVAPGTSSHQTSSSQLAHASYGIASKPASEAHSGLQTSSYSNSPATPHAFAVSSGSPAVSFSYIEHGSSGQQPAASSNYAKTISSTQNFQAPASQSFGFVPYSENGQTQSTQGASQVVQFPSSGGAQRNTRKSQQGAESHVLSPNYYDSSATHSVSVSASIPTFESHTSFDQVDAISKTLSAGDDRFTQVSYPSNHRSSYDGSK